MVADGSLVAGPIETGRGWKRRQYATSEDKIMANMRPQEFERMMRSMGCRFNKDLVERLGCDKDRIARFRSGAVPIPLYIAHAMRWLLHQHQAQEKR